MILYFIYAVIRHIYPLILSTSIALTLTAFLLALKLKYK